MTKGSWKTLKVPINEETHREWVASFKTQPTVLEQCIKASWAITLATYASDGSDCIVPLSVVEEDRTCSICLPQRQPGQAPWTKD
jgi:hypothetical protein